MNQTMEPIRETSFTRQYINNNSFDLNITLVNNPADQRHRELITLDAIRLFKTLIQTSSRAFNSFIINDHEIKKEFIKPGKKIKIVCFKEAQNVPLHFNFVLLKGEFHLNHAADTVIKILVFDKDVTDEEIIEKHSIKEEPKTKSKVASTKASKINLNNLTITSSDSDSEDERLFRHTRPLSTNPFKKQTKIDDQQLLLANNKEIITNDKRTLSKIQTNESLESKETKIKSTSKNTKTISTSSSPSSPSSSVKRESDNELQALNGQFLNKKKFKKSPSIELLGSVDSSSNKTAKPIKKSSQKKKSTESPKMTRSKRDKSKVDEIKEQENDEPVDSETRLQILNNYKKEVENYRKQAEIKEVKNKEIEEKVIDHDKDYDDQVNVRSDSNTSDDFNGNQCSSSCSSNSGDTEDTDIVYVDSKLAKKSSFDYVALDVDDKLEKQIQKIKVISELTAEQINYMVLRDVNYFVEIFAGQCEHSWRHMEYKKFSNKSSKILYSNAAICSYRDDQYMSATKALQQLFSRKNHNYDEYIVKVLLPEALIKICMRIYQCSKYDAEDYLHKNDRNNPIDFKDKDNNNIDY